MSLEKYWIEPRADGDYLMTVNGDQRDEREVEYLGDGSTLSDAYNAAMRDMANVVRTASTGRPASADHPNPQGEHHEHPNPQGEHHEHHRNP